MDPLPSRSGAIKCIAMLLLAMGHTFRAIGASGTIQDVQHVVILTLENRSFDHYFGSLSGVKGFSDPNALLLPDGNTVFYQPQSNGYVLPFHVSLQCLGDVAHDEPSGMLAWDSGWCDQWLEAKGLNAMAYYTRQDLAFYYALADAYTICDDYHCSVLGPTCPNRLYLMSGMVDPNGTGGGPVLANYVPTNGYSWTTYPERLQNAGITWRVYQPSYDYFPINALAWFSQYMQAGPGNPLYDRGIALVPDVVSAFQADVSNGTLPQVSWILPGAGTSEHPCFPPANGEWLTQQLLAALASNPAVYNSTVFFITYDENGGFFDHIPPPVPPTGTAAEFVNGLPIGLGVRVPMLIISPWTRGGHVCSQVFDHTSILRFLEAWTGVAEPNISAWRRRVCGDLLSAFDFTAPNTNAPALPAVVPVPCTSCAYPAPPQPQVAPTQESGFRPSRHLAYQPNATCWMDRASGQLWIDLTNSGRAWAHLAVYANGCLAWPRQYDIPPGGSALDAFLVSTNASRKYDLSCYGPNGFQRRFAGTLNSTGGQLEISSSLDPESESIDVTLNNASSNIVNCTISNMLQTADVRVYVLPPQSGTNDSFLALTNTGGAYSLTVTSTNDALFLRRLAGHLELGPPPLRLSAVGAELHLAFPAWAANYSVEFNSDLTSNLWQPLGVSPVLLSNRIVIKVPIAPAGAYFRLRH